MLVKILLGLLAVIIIFVTFVSTREGKFIYARSGIINAPAEKIFPYISNFKLGEQWSPYEKMDPNMKKNFIGPDAEVGSQMKFEGNSNAGSGRLEILKIIPNESVDIKLTMTKPFKAENLVQYKLTPVEGGTEFTWTMSGDGGFSGKLLNVFIDCEKMVADQFSVGINNLKALIESQK